MENEREWDEVEEKVEGEEPTVQELADEHYKEEQRIAYEKTR